jgi:type II secretory pathway component GspD/PulD (secretin)
MRARTRLGAAALILAAGGLMLSAAPNPPAKKAEAKAPQDDRDELAEQLMNRVTIDKPMENMKLRDVIDFFASAYDLSVLVDSRSFGNMPAAVAQGLDDDPVLNAQVTIPVMRKVRLATVLKHVADQIGGVYLIYPDHIKLVGTERAAALTSPPLQNYMSDPPEDTQEPRESLIRSVPLVNINFNDRPLQEALREVESRTNRNVVLAPQAGEKGQTSVTARFTNVPVDTAVATLAEMAGLKMARKGNVLLVTTPERAKEFAPPAPPNPFGGLCMPPGMQFLAPATAEVEELRKKVAELEKTVQELRKK